MKGQLQLLAWPFTIVIIVTFTVMGLYAIILTAGALSAVVETADDLRKAELLSYILLRDERFTREPGILDASKLETSGFVINPNIDSSISSELNHLFFPCVTEGGYYDYYYSYVPIGFCNYDYSIHIESGGRDWYAGMLGVESSCSPPTHNRFNFEMPGEKNTFYGLIDYGEGVRPAKIEISVFDFGRIGIANCMFVQALLNEDLTFEREIVGPGEDLYIKVRYRHINGRWYGEFTRKTVDDSGRLIVAINAMKSVDHLVSPTASFPNCQIEIYKSDNYRTKNRVLKIRYCPTRNTFIGNWANYENMVDCSNANLVGC